MTKKGSFFNIFRIFFIKLPKIGVFLLCLVVFGERCLFQSGVKNPKKYSLNCLFFRCRCGACITLDSSKQCLCCVEVHQYKELMLRFFPAFQVTDCITQHQLFEGSILNEWSLDIAWYVHKYILSNSGFEILVIFFFAI